MERGLLMLLHSIIIGLILYIVMVFVFKQNDKVAENRSILIASVILIYMIIFGHSIPNKINGDL
jgi:putative effector of murein hydrolase